MQECFAGLLPRVLDLVMDAFVLQGTEEAIRHCIVIAVASATHARRGAEGGKLPLVR